jgi:energy-coupling factor transporter ATP-binding protein EcfA2/ABC-type transport system involved in cytochrome c biogenesis ATPase subunit
MQLRHLSIPHFRNLRELKIDFKTHLPVEPNEHKLKDELGLPTQDKPIRSRALIGANGSGKSNLIEALITIFRDIDLNRDPAFDYTLEYGIRDHVVKIQADSSKQKRPFVWVDGDKVTQDYLTTNQAPGQTPRDDRRGPRLLPTHIFAYYSGRNERIETLFQDHQLRFTKRQEITAEAVLDESTLTDITDTDAKIRAIKAAEKHRAAQLRYAGDDRLRRLFYCRGGHSQLVLLACLLADDPVFNKVLNNLHIESLESALFVLKEPHRLREKRRGGKYDETDITEGDNRFWYARGNVVSEFLDKLWQVAWAPIEQTADKRIDFRGRTEQQKQLYLFVPSQDKLKQLGELVGGVDSFFRYAEGAYIGDLIDEVRIKVKKRNVQGDVEFAYLSEGEIQMLTVLGLMRITREDHCLFLLDEPDTHLNPIWKLRYFDDIEGVLSTEGSDGMIQGESQILITTHDPMMIGSLKREQVHILRQQDNETVAIPPDEHPQGMGVTGLLKSELFGLSSTLDIETERRLFRRNELLARKTLGNPALSPDENAELTRLSGELADLGFSAADFRDPDYALFVRKMAEHRRFRKPTLTPQEQADQDRIASQIIEEILREETGA